MLLVAYLLDDDLEAGCVEQPRHIRLRVKQSREPRAHNLLFPHQIPVHKRARGGVGDAIISPLVENTLLFQ